jgi:hypothetical protein
VLRSTLYPRSWLGSCPFRRWPLGKWLGNLAEVGEELPEVLDDQVRVGGVGEVTAAVELGIADDVVGPGDGMVSIWLTSVLARRRVFLLGAGVGGAWRGVEPQSVRDK